MVPLHFQPGLISLAVGNELSDDQIKQMRKLLESDVEIFIRDKDWILGRIQQLYDVEIAAEADSSCFWPHWHSFNNDILTIKMSGYEASGAHWTGRVEVKPNDTDYKFYVWLVSNRDYHRIVWNHELADIKKKWQALN